MCSEIVFQKESQGGEEDEVEVTPGREESLRSATKMSHAKRLPAAIKVAGKNQPSHRKYDQKGLPQGEFNTSLPDALKLRIFMFVCDGSTNAREAANLALVCREWKRVATDDAIWFPLCVSRCFVDSRGQDRQAKALADAEEREAERQKKQADEARRMAYGLDHHRMKNDQEALKKPYFQEVSAGGGLGGADCPTPLWGSNWRECFLLKRKENLIGISAKLVFLMRLLPTLRQEGHRVLIFSQSHKMLNTIELLLKDGSFSFLRIDGSISNPTERQRRVDLFNSDPSYFCFLLTTLVGGIGLNLTGADRVVIIDPSWNPTHDNQVRSLLLSLFALALFHSLS